MQYQSIYAQNDMSGVVESATSNQAGADTWVDSPPPLVVEGWAEWGDWGDCGCCCCTGACSME